MLETIPDIRIIVDKIRRQDSHLADQLRRAVNTVLLNQAEADGNRAGKRRMRLETAHGPHSRSDLRHAHRGRMGLGH